MVYVFREKAIYLSTILIVLTIADRHSFISTDDTIAVFSAAVCRVIVR